MISAYVTEGGNVNTAHTQFQKWRTAYEAARKQSSARSIMVRVEVKEGGRILLPAELRVALGIGEGDALMAEVVDGELRLLPRATAVRRAQEMVRQFIPAGANVVDDFIADRRREAQREAGE
ncbi:MAG: AbrB/MazE/SpoVT family DNA-binding domain-containing protein [Devosia sp.]